MSFSPDSILGLRTLSLRGADVSFEFAHPLPAWAWVLVVIACVLAACWSYARLLGPRWARYALAGLRALLLILIVFLLCGPRLSRQNERTEQDWLVVLADRSASLTIADVEDGGTRRTRESQLRETFAGAEPTLAAIGKERGVLRLGFDAGTFDLPADLGVPSGRRTAIGQALDQALRRVAARPVAGLVLLSDGRSADVVPRATLRQLESRKIPVFVVPLGSERPMPDYTIARVEAPGAAFVGDFVPVQVHVERSGGNTGEAMRARVQLVDDRTGTVLDERELSSTGGSEAVTLTTRPDSPEPSSWSVRVVPETPDLSRENNQAPVRVEISDRPIRVVYFDGYPRWEYRYLKNVLVRERSVRSAAMILASDRKYLQEGSDPLASVPRTAQEWSGIDVVMLGDLRPNLFSEEQLRQIRTLVAERGAGLLWIGGPGATPNAWRGTPLADLLPFTIASDAMGGMQEWTTPVVMMPAPGASRYSVLRLGETPSEPWPEVLSSQGLGWPVLRYAQRIAPESLKPTTEVIALASPVDGETSQATPLILTMRYGAGRVVYVGTDETWRYRYGRGETLQERLWIPLVRLLARESLGRSGKPALLTLSPERSASGQSVQITLRLLDQSLLEKRPAGISVRIAPIGGSGRVHEITLKPESVSDDAELPGVFSGSFYAGDPGLYRVEPTEALLTGLEISAALEVVAPDDELRTPQTDHALLAELAAATGGAVLTPARLAELPDLLPNRQLRLLGAPDVETLWDKPIVWLVLMLLMAMEWMGRRLIKLS